MASGAGINVIRQELVGLLIQDLGYTLLLLLPSSASISTSTQAKFASFPFDPAAKQPTCMNTNFLPVLGLGGSRILVRTLLYINLKFFGATG